MNDHMMDADHISSGVICWICTATMKLEVGWPLTTGYSSHLSNNQALHKTPVKSTHLPIKRIWANLSFVLNDYEC